MELESLYCIGTSISTHRIHTNFLSYRISWRNNDAMSCSNFYQPVRSRAPSFITHFFHYNFLVKIARSINRSTSSNKKSFNRTLGPYDHISTLKDIEPQRIIVGIRSWDVKVNPDASNDKYMMIKDRSLHANLFIPTIRAIRILSSWNVLLGSIEWLEGF